VKTIQKIPVYIGLGSNQGRPEENLGRAKGHIQSMTGVGTVVSSSVYYTEPQGVKDQPWFANQILRVLCHPAWTPELFMRHLLDIEHMLGRKRNMHWGPRRIDCDLLLFGRQVVNSSELVLPHPRMTERAFVLVPLVELTPDLCLPNGTRIKDCLQNLVYRREGRRIWQGERYRDQYSGAVRPVHQNMAS